MTAFLLELELRLKTAEDLVGQLQQALAKSQDDLAQANRNLDLKSRDTKEEIQLLKHRLQACSEALESKDMELANLQSALGQYYAESDAQVNTSSWNSAMIRFKH
jgi:chromosome segregation ATPase